MPVLLLLISVLVTYGRLLVPGHDLSLPGSYEAIAHIWVGFLLCLWIFGPYRKSAFLTLLALTVLEVVMFMTKS